jgi:transposase
VPDSDEHAIAITHGYSKDHRPDLKQAILELMVSQDGGVPLMSKSWDGNASDTQIFQERAQGLIATFQGSPSPRYLVADAKLYNEENAAHLHITPYGRTMTLDPRTPWSRGCIRDTQSSASCLDIPPGIWPHQWRHQ